jgi:ribonuclease HI
VKGHAGNELNERCDRRASAEIAKVKSRRHRP